MAMSAAIATAELRPDFQPAAESGSGLDFDFESESGRPLPQMALDAPVRARIARLPLVQARPRRVEAPTFSLATFAGRLIELSSLGATAALSLTALLLHEAQHQGEPVAWVQGGESLFHPPDLAAVGVDLRALAVLRPTGPGALGKAVSHLLRSGAFGLVVIDLGAGDRTADAQARFAREALPPPLQSRLERTAAAHGTCVLCLTGASGGGRAESGGAGDGAGVQNPSLGPLVSFRGEARRVRVGGRLQAEVVALKDKRSAPGWRCAVELEPIAGLT